MTLIKIPDPEYFALERISNSKCRDYERCPHRYFLEHVKGVLPPKSTKALLEGAAAHCLTLEGEEEYNQRFVVKPNFPRSDKGKAEEREWVKENADGREVLTKTQDSQTRYIADAVWGHRHFKDLYQRIQPEVEMAALWEQEGFECKAKLDVVSVPSAVMIDMKTTQNADPSEFVESMCKWGYYAQFEFYINGAHLAGAGPPPAEWEVYTIVCDKQCPVRAQLSKIDPKKLLAEHERNIQTLRNIRRSMETGIWKADWQLHVNLI